jgi:hypothetical protein
MAGPWNTGLTPGPWLPTQGNAIPLVQWQSFSMAAATASSSSQIVASSAGLRVLALALMVTNSTSASNCSLSFQAGTTTTQGTAQIVMSSTQTAFSFVTLPYSPVGWFSTPSGEPLIATNIGAAISGLITFIYI